MLQKIEVLKRGIIQGVGISIGLLIFIFGFFLVRGAWQSSNPTSGQGDPSNLYSTGEDVITKEKWNALIEKTTPVGEVIWYASNSCPNGYLLADGSIINNNTYSELYNILGDVFGSEGKLPDLRGEFIRGWSNGKNVAGESSRVFGSWQNSTHINDYVKRTHYITFTNVDESISIGSQVSHSAGDTHTISRNSIGVRPRNVALLPCVKY